MTTPIAFAVDQNSTITPRIGFVSDPTTGAPSIVTVNGSGAQVVTPVTGGGGGGAGTVQSINSIAPDGAGNVTLVANDVNGIANFIGWNLDTNVATPPSPAATFTPVSGTFPTGGFTMLKASGTTPQTLDGQTYSAGDFAEFSPALGVWTRISGAGNGVLRPAFNYTPATAWTGSTSESGQQMPLQLVPNGTTLIAGQRFQADLYATFSNDSAQTTLKHYINGTVALSGVTFQTSTFNTASFSRLLLIVIDATHVLVRIEFDNSSTSRQAAEAIVTVTTGTGLSVGWTFTNTTTGKTATAVLADSRFFQV